jgi:hypothetical protein
VFSKWHEESGNIPFYFTLIFACPARELGWLLAKSIAEAEGML